MKRYTNRIRNRVRALWGILAAMLVYMVAVGELGGGDSRMMTPLAGAISRIIFFGGLIWVIVRIVYNRKLLKDRAKLQADALVSLDERQQWLHDKSGGIVADLLLLALLIATCTAALFNMPAFYTALSILLTLIVTKAGSYVYYDRIASGGE